MTRNRLKSRIRWSRDPERGGTVWNHGAKPGVIISRMRRRGRLLNLVALFALIIGALPTSALASLFADTPCKMACCRGLPAHGDVLPQACTTGCEQKQDASRSSSAVFSESSPQEECRCSIGSTPQTPLHELAAAPAANIAHPIPVADLAPTAIQPRFLNLDRAVPGILGTDAGPPASRPNYAFLGRAPPVLLA